MSEYMDNLVWCKYCGKKHNTEKEHLNCEIEYYKKIIENRKQKLSDIENKKNEELEQELDCKRAYEFMKMKNSFAKLREAITEYNNIVKKQKELNYEKYKNLATYYAWYGTNEIKFLTDKIEDKIESSLNKNNNNSELKKIMEGFL